jgi:hypothetical protein
MRRPEHGRQFIPHRATAVAFAAHQLALETTDAACVFQAIQMHKLRFRAARRRALAHAFEQAGGVLRSSWTSVHDKNFHGSLLSGNGPIA